MKVVLFTTLTVFLGSFAATTVGAEKCKPKYLRNRKCKVDTDCPQLQGGNLQFVCYEGGCVPKDSLPDPVQCGLKICDIGQECCNESCGICVDKGGACTKQFCRPAIPDLRKPKMSPSFKVECNVATDCPPINCIKAPCPSFTCEDHQCTLQEPEDQCEEDVDCPNRDDKCIGGQCLRVEIMPLPVFENMECEDKYDCPQVRCMAGAPCPSYECVAGECVAEYDTLPAPPKGQMCSKDIACPQPLCMPGAICPTYKCVGGACVAETIELNPIDPLKEIECVQDFQCPQPGCIVGAPCPFFVCEENTCVAKYNDNEEPEPVSCGASMCKNGDVCCNPSCGICTPPGGFCTQQACDLSYEKCNVDDDCSNKDDKCLGGKCSKVPEMIPVSGCTKDFECPQPLCAPGSQCPIFMCKGGECVAEFTGPAPEFLNDQPGGILEIFQKCNVDDDCSKEGEVCVEGKCAIRIIESLPKTAGCEKDFECPQPRCAAGAPCPFFVCKEGECVAEFTEPSPEFLNPMNPGGTLEMFQKCNDDTDCSNPGEECFEGHCATRLVEMLPSTTPGCTKDFECPQPACAPGSLCPVFMCKGGECVAEFTGPAPEFLNPQPLGTLEIFQKCHVNSDCTNMGEACVEGKCEMRFVEMLPSESMGGGDFDSLGGGDFDSLGGGDFDSMAGGDFGFLNEDPVECNVDDDCPRVACDREPCPCSVCVEHKCTIRAHASG